MTSKGEHGTTMFGGVLSQTLLALSFDTLDLIAGSIAALVSSYVVKMPWILIFYPPLLTVRGNISGMFSGRLTTGLHSGLILPSIRKNTEYFYSLRASIFLMSFINAIIVGFLAYGVSLVFAPTGNISLPLLISIAILSMMLPTILSIFFLAPLIAIISYKKGIDPDIIVYPVLSTLNDIVVSAIYVSIIVVIVFWENIFIMLSYVLIPLFVLFATYFLKYQTNKNFRKTISEGMFTIIILLIISNFTGGILSKLRYQIERYPHILAIYPCLLSMIGDEGSIIASTTTTRLSLGNIKPSLRDIGNYESRTHIFGVIVAGFIVATGFATIGTLIYIISLTGILQTILIATMTNLILVLPIIFLSFGSAIITFKRGLNPDNFTIPIITSSSDFLTTTSLFIVIRVIMSL